jgi:hypothetical protein
MIVICETCGHPMASGTSCTDEGALRWGGEGDILETVTWPCHDCGVLPGGLHHPRLCRGDLPRVRRAVPRVHRWRARRPRPPQLTRQDGPRAPTGHGDGRIAPWTPCVTHPAEA